MDYTRMVVRSHKGHIISIIHKVDYKIVGINFNADKMSAMGRVESVKHLRTCGDDAKGQKYR
jgi:uncharacterized protein YehS (DUF1456 family)